MRIFRVKVITMIDSNSTGMEQAVNKQVWEIPLRSLKTLIQLFKELQEDRKTIDICFGGDKKELTFRGLQDEYKPWNDHNFPDRDVYYPLLGAMEELGELAHAHLKDICGVKGTHEQHHEQHHEKKKDAIGDIVVFLADYCTANGIDFQKAVEDTWNEVKKRDYNKMREENK